MSSEARRLFEEGKRNEEKQKKLVEEYHKEKVKEFYERLPDQVWDKTKSNLKRGDSKGEVVILKRAKDDVGYSLRMTSLLNSFSLDCMSCTTNLPDEFVQQCLLPSSETLKNVLKETQLKPFLVRQGLEVKVLRKELPGDITILVQWRMQ